MSEATETITEQQPTVVKDEPVAEKADADTKPEDVKEADADPAPAQPETEEKPAEEKTEQPAEGETAAEQTEAPEPAAEQTESAEPAAEAEPEPEVEEVIEIPSGNGEWVLVTGATGFIGSNIIKQLVESGEFRVRGTVRSLENNERLDALKGLLTDSKLDLEFVEADLKDADSWKSAVKGCDYVIHCAAVYPDVENKENTEEAYKEGTLSILKACQESESVKRIVMTSSLSAVSSGHNVVKSQMNEDTWADIDKTVGAEERSKVIAERAAWDFMKELPEGCSMELSVVNPGFCVGPPLMKSEGKSAELIKKLLTREYEQLPKLNYSIIDVRDAALSHIRAMMIKQSAGQRHLVCQSPIWLKDMANILSQEFSSKGWNVSTTQVPYIKIWIKSHLKSGQEMKKILPYVGKVYNYDTKKMKKILQVEPREVKESIVEMAQAMIDLGMVEKVEKKEKPEKKSRKFSLRRDKTKKAASAETEGEEKKDDPEKEEETSAEAADTEAPKDETAGPAEAEPAAESTAEPALQVETEAKPEVEKAGSEPEGSVPSDEEKKEEAATSDPESSKKKEKKEKKEKKKGLFSFSFKKNKKPAVEKKEEEAAPAESAEKPEESAEPKEEAAATEAAPTEPAAAEPTAEDKPAEETETKSEETTDAEPTTSTEAPEIRIEEPAEPAKTEEPKTESEESKPEETKTEETTPTPTTNE